MEGKRYLVIVRKAFFNPNSEETILVEDQIECYGVNMYFCPRLFGGTQLIDNRDQVWTPVKIGIY